MILNEDSVAPLRVSELRKALRGLPGSAIIVCEDGGFMQAIVEELDVVICHFVAFSNSEYTGRHFLTKEDINEFRVNNSNAIILRLKEPVLRLAIAGRLSDNE